MNGQVLHQLQCMKEGTLFYYQHSYHNVEHIILCCPVCGSKRVRATGRYFPGVNETQSMSHRDAAVSSQAKLHESH